MTGQKRPVGRPTIYDGSQRGRGYTDHYGKQKPGQRRTGPAVADKAQEKPVQQTESEQEALQRPVMRRREQENEQKMRQLRRILVLLVALLFAAIFHEIILGHGTKMTGQERMAAQQQKKQDVILVQEPETDLER